MKSCPFAFLSLISAVSHKAAADNQQKCSYQLFCFLRLIPFLNGLCMIYQIFRRKRLDRLLWHISAIQCLRLFRRLRTA